MKSSYILSALAGAALVASSPLVAQSRGGGHSGNHGASKSGNMGSARSGTGSTVRPESTRSRPTGTTTRARARQDSKRSGNASGRTTDRANQNSVLSDSGSTMGSTEVMQTNNGVTIRTNARQNSQGSANASDRALARANENSALSSTGMMGNVPPCTRQVTDGCMQTNERGMRMKAAARTKRR